MLHSYFAALSDLADDLPSIPVLVSCNCNDRGTCLSTGTIYDVYTLSSNGTANTANQYSLWDAAHTTSCVCDLGGSPLIRHLFFC